MKIVLFNDNHTCNGGAERYFFDLKSRLQSKADLSVISIGFGAKTESGKDYYIFKAPQSNLAKLFWRIMPQPFLYFRLRRLLKKIQPDVIHLHNIKQYSLTVLQSLQPYPIVQTMHDYGQICPISYNIHKNHEVCETGLRWQCLWQHRLKFDPLGFAALTASFFIIKHKLKKTARLFFAPSPQLVHYLQNNGFHPAEVMLPFQQLPEQCPHETVDPHHFLYVGNLVTGKGIYLLIEEFALAWQLNNKLTLTIVGSGYELPKVQNWVRQHHLQEQITFTGWQTDLQPYYSTCAALIFPSIWMESFGLVITEAMGYARPVIGSNHATTKWLVEDGQTGLIFDRARKGDLAEKMLQIAGNKALIEKLGTNGRNKLEHLIDNDALLEKIITHYKTLANNLA